MCMGRGWVGKRVGREGGGVKEDFEEGKVEEEGTSREVNNEGVEEREGGEKETKESE